MSPSYTLIDNLRTRFKSLGFEELSRQIEAGEIKDWRLDIAEEVLRVLRREEAQEWAQADQGALAVGAAEEANDIARDANRIAAGPTARQLVDFGHRRRACGCGARPRSELWVARTLHSVGHSPCCT